jgi:hypothetical protein
MEVLNRNTSGLHEALKKIAAFAMHRVIFNFQLVKYQYICKIKAVIMSHYKILYNNNKHLI